MPDLDLQMNLAENRVSVNEGITLSLTLRNIGPAAVDIPSPYDITDALTIYVTDMEGKTVRKMNGLTGQAMMGQGRIDNRKEIGRLESRDAWSWDLNLAQLHYPISAGEYFLSAAYRVPASKAPIRTPQVRINVSSGSESTISNCVDNPVIERMHTLVSSVVGGERVHVLRCYNYDTPLASWYSQRVLREVQDAAPIIGQANYFQTRNFDPAFVCWLAWQSGGSVSASRLVWGKETGTRFSARVPAQGAMLRYAYYTHEDDLSLIFQFPDASVGCYRLGKDECREVFHHKPEGEGGGRRIFHATAAGLDIFSAETELTWERVSPEGKRSGVRRLHSSRLRADDCWYNASDGTVCAVFRHSVRDSQFEVVAATTDGILHRVGIERLPLREEIDEISYAFSRSGRVLYLCSTKPGKLYFGSNEFGAQRVASGESGFVPRLLFNGRTYLGYHTQNEGFRYRVYDRRHRGSHLVNFEEEVS